MKQNLLKEKETGSKNALLKKRIITHYIYNGSSTITDLAKELDLSVPTTTKFINEMCEDNYITTMGNWRPVAAAIQAYTDSTRNQDTSLEWTLRNLP